jgi:uncharacterized protein (DUF433 family)
MSSGPWSQGPIPYSDDLPVPGDAGLIAIEEEEPVTRREHLLERISVDPRVCFGKPCIRGTRIWVSLILENLAEGISDAELLAAYPQLQPDDLRAAQAYAAEMTRECTI